MKTRTVHLGRQWSVFLDDRPNTLGTLAAELGAAGVNILALTLAEGIDHGYVRLVTDRPDATAAELRTRGYLFFEKEVLLLELANAPGCLGRAAQALGAAGVNIEYVYCAANPDQRKGLIVMKADRTDEALRILEAVANP